MKSTENMIKAVIFGHAVADALGVPVEAQSREELAANPVTDMRGFGSYPVPAGSWSDDTSMSLAELDSLADGIVDLDRIMMNFGKWYCDEECVAAQYARENNIPYEVVTDVETFLNVERPEIYRVYEKRMEYRNRQIDDDEPW